MVGSPEWKVFPIQGLQSRLNFHICAHFLYHLCGYVSYLIVAYGRRPPLWQDMAWSTSKVAPHAHLELTLIMFQPYRRHRASLTLTLTLTLAQGELSCVPLWVRPVAMRMHHSLPHSPSICVGGLATGDKCCTLAVEAAVALSANQIW